MMEGNERKRPPSYYSSEDDSELPSPKKLHAELQWEFQSNPQGTSRLSLSMSDSDGSADEAEPTQSTGKVAESFIKKPKQKEPTYSSVAAKLMAKMGYKEGKGLGKNEQGRANIVETSQQKGRRGLGLSVTGFESSDVEWNFVKDEVAVKETVDWMPPCDEPAEPLDEMMTWIKEGKKKQTIDDETLFCSEKVLSDVIKCKSVFDNLESEEMRKARTRSNPYETIRGAFFQNRAAMKMANMDAVLDFMFTNPKDSDGVPVVGPNDILYFADICAGPGGFSEYILWRRKEENAFTKGFGFTLKGLNDFKLEEFFAAPSEYFEPHYGVGMLDGDGDIYRPDNQQVFRDFVSQNTDGQGVHFVMADGGFSVEGQENLQEVLSKRLYLCQFLVALSILRPGGHFVCKLFDVFTPFSVGLVYLMYKAFDHVAIFNPVTSRPANSERYIVCKSMKETSTLVRDYMDEINKRMDKISGILSDMDIMEVVPFSILKQDTHFFDYIVNSNEELGNKQAIALVKIQTFAQNTDLREERQSAIREACLQEWKIPDKARTAPSRSDGAEKRLDTLLKGEKLEFSSDFQVLDAQTLQTKVHSVYDYRCMVCGQGERCILLSLGKTHVYKWGGKPNTKWTKLHETRLELPEDTILDVEFVNELRGEGRGQRRVLAAHVIDAVMLNGIDISTMHFQQRQDKIKKFVKVVNKLTRLDLVQIKAKEVVRFEDISQVFDRLQRKVVKGSSQPRIVYCTTDSGVHYVPTGLLFIRTVKDPWMMAFSNSQKRKYFYNTSSREAKFEIPPDCIASYSGCQKSRVFWSWEGVQLMDDQSTFDQDKLGKQTVMNFVLEKTGQKHCRR